MVIFHFMKSQSSDFRAFSRKAGDRNESCDLLLLHADLLDFPLQEGGKKGLAGKVENQIPHATATDTINLARLLGGLGLASLRSDKDASHPQRIPMRKVEPSRADEAAKC